MCGRVYLDGMVRSASYTLARPRAYATGAEERPGRHQSEAPEQTPQSRETRRHGARKRPKNGAVQGLEKGAKGRLTGKEKPWQSFGKAHRFQAPAPAWHGVGGLPCYHVSNTRQGPTLQEGSWKEAFCYGFDTCHGDVIVSSFNQV